MEKTKNRWALRVSPKKESSRRKSFFLKGFGGGNILVYSTKEEARGRVEKGFYGVFDWVEDQKLKVVPVKVRVTVEEI